MLEANNLLCIFGVGFQLYGQLKQSLHKGAEVLGRSAVSMASQTTTITNGHLLFVMGALIL